MEYLLLSVTGFACHSALPISKNSAEDHPFAFSCLYGDIGDCNVLSLRVVMAIRRSYSLNQDLGNKTDVYFPKDGSWQWQCLTNSKSSQGLLTCLSTS